MKLRELGELGLIERIAQHGAGDLPRVVLGIGDDAAVVRSDTGKLLLFTCDAQIEGVHFLPNGMSPRDLGRRAAAVNLSDIAAMGGEPKFALVSLASSPDRDVSLVDEIYKGLSDELTDAGAVIVGGNTTSVSDGLMLDVFMVGEVEEKALLTRGGAGEGEVLCVTGTLGASRAGLVLAGDSDLTCDAVVDAEALARYRAPTPRMKVGRFLGKSGLVGACLDVSDGLLQDSARIAAMSGVGVRVDAANVPVSPAATGIASRAGADAMEWALTGGEDFELLFTVSASECDGLLASLKTATDVVASVIGEITKGEPVVRVFQDGVEVEFGSAGFEHFK